MTEFVTDCEQVKFVADSAGVRVRPSVSARLGRVQSHFNQPPIIFFALRFLDF